MSSFCLGFISLDNSGTGMHNSGFLDDETIAVKALDIATGICKSDFIHFVGVQPDFALTAFEHRRSKALLKFQ